MLNSLTPLFSAFAFIITPVCAAYKSFIAHIYFTAHANFKDDIKQIVKVITDYYNQNKIHVRFYSFDGDKA